jgi:hypothetical protein
MSFPNRDVPRYAPDSESGAQAHVGDEQSGTASDGDRPVDDGTVPEKQIWRWKDDGGAIGRSSQ